MLGWAGGSPSKPHTHMWPWFSLPVVTGLSCPQSLPRDGTPSPRPSHMASFQQGVQVSLLTIPKKKQSQRLLNILRPMPGAVIGHVVPASLRASPGSRLERTLERFIAGWPGCTVQESAEACGTYCVDPQCVWVWGVRTGWWGMKSFYSKWVSEIVFILTACHFLKKTKETKNAFNL